MKVLGGKGLFCILYGLELCNTGYETWGFLPMDRALYLLTEDWNMAFFFSTTADTFVCVCNISLRDASCDDTLNVEIHVVTQTLFYSEKGRLEVMNCYCI